MTVKCPHCNSQNYHPMSQARESGATLGGLAGIAYGLSSLFRGARQGAVMCRHLGPTGVTVGGVVGAFASAVMTGTAGYAVGGIVGDQIDKRVLRNHQCDDCGGIFKVEEVAVMPELSTTN